MYEQWKLEIALDHQIAQGMEVEVHSYGNLSPLWSGVVIVRQGIVGKIIHWKKRLVEYELVMNGAKGLSVTLLIPIKWVRMGILDRYWHY